MKTRQKKWKLYLYYNGILVKRVTIPETEAPADNNYAIRVLFKKSIFKSHIASIIVKPVRLLKNDDRKRKTYWGTTLETGIEV